MGRAVEGTGIKCEAGTCGECGPRQAADGCPARHSWLLFRGAGERVVSRVVGGIFKHVGLPSGHPKTTTPTIRSGVCRWETVALGAGDNMRSRRWQIGFHGMSGRLQVIFGLLVVVIPAVADRHPAGFTPARRPLYRPCTCGCYTARVQLCQLRGACLEAGLILFTCG